MITMEYIAASLIKGLKTIFTIKHMQISCMADGLQV